MWFGVCVRVLYTEHEVIKKMILDHIAAIRAQTMYRNALIYLYIEANMSWITADYVAGLTRRDGNIVVASHDSSKYQRYGVVTGAAEKENYAATLIRLLMDNLLYLAERIIGAQVKEDVANLLNQFGLFRREVRAPVDVAHGKWIFSWTGKSPGKKDDLILALMICIYWMERQLQTDEHREWARQFGGVNED